MDITTIKLATRTKTELDRFRQGSESYDRIIQKLLADAQSKELRSKLIEGYQKKAKEDLDILKEWESASGEIE
jgi:hypothetical protein